MNKKCVTLTAFFSTVGLTLGNQFSAIAVKWYVVEIKISVKEQHQLKFLCKLTIKIYIVEHRADHGVQWLQYHFYNVSCTVFRHLCTHIALLVITPIQMANQNMWFNSIEVAMFKHCSVGNKMMTSRSLNVCHKSYDDQMFQFRIGWITRFICSPTKFSSFFQELFNDSQN